MTPAAIKIDANVCQLTSRDTTNYTYDHNGNETAAGNRTFTYDLANRVTSTTSGSSTTTYSYNGDGNRLSTSSGGTTTNYLWDTNNQLPQLALERDGNGNVLRSYLYGLRRIAMTSGGNTYYYLYDRLGSVVNLTSSAGATEWTYTYEPFGSARTTTQNDPNAPTNPMQFTGELQDTTTGLYDLRARQYDTTTGRFLNQDPAPQTGNEGLSAYTYANDQPLTYTDPSGMRLEDGDAGGGGGSPPPPPPPPAPPAPPAPPISGSGSDNTDSSGSLPDPGPGYGGTFLPDPVTHEWGGGIWGPIGNCPQCTDGLIAVVHGRVLPAAQSPYNHILYNWWLRISLKAQTAAGVITVIKGLYWVNGRETKQIYYKGPAELTGEGKDWLYAYHESLWKFGFVGSKGSDEYLHHTNVIRQLVQWLGVDGDGGAAWSVYIP